MKTVNACVFDAYGTLFDVHSAVRNHMHEIGPGAEAFSQLWRNKQLEYSWVRSLMHRHRDFWLCTADALDFAMESTGLENRAGIREKLMGTYKFLDAYPEVPGVLQRLKSARLRTAILSNGSPDMLAAAVGAARLDKLVDLQLSVEEVGIYKPDPRVYQLAADRLGLAPERISFQSSNAWDVAGAHASGFRAIWINRTGQPPEYGLKDQLPEIPSLAALPEIVAAEE